METQELQNSTTTEETEVHTETKEVEEKKLFTQDDMNDAVEKRVKRERAKFEKEIARIKAEAMTEAQRLSQLSEDERKKEEQDKVMEENKRLQQQLEEQRAEIAYRDLISATRKELDNLRLPSSFAELLVGKDAETTKTNLTNFSKEFHEAVTKEVNERLKNSPKPANNKQSDVKDTMKKFKQMSLAEKQALYVSDPDLYKQLSGRK